LLDDIMQSERAGSSHEQQEDDGRNRALLASD